MRGQRRGLKYPLPTPAGAWTAVTLEIVAADENAKRLWVLHKDDIRVSDGDSITFTLPVRRTDAGLVLDIKLTDA